MASELRVECYSGYRAAQRPQRFALGEHWFEVRRIDDQWYGPAAMYFRVFADDGNVYVLRHDEERDEWSLDAFRLGR